MKRSPERTNYFLNLPTRWKFSIAITLLLLAMGVMTIFIMEKALANSYHQELFEDGVAIGRNIAENIAKPILIEDLVTIHNILQSALKIENETVYIYVLDHDRQILAHTFEEGFPAELLDPSELLIDNIEHLHEIDTDAGHVFESTVPIMAGELGSVHIGMTDRILDEYIFYIKNEMIGIIVIFSLLGLILVYLINLIVTRPLVDLAFAAQKIGSGDLDVDLSSARKDEIGILKNSLDQMARALRTTIAKKEESSGALQRSEALYRSLIENINLGITYIDEDHNIIMVNSAQAAIFNRPRESFIGKKCFREFEKKTAVCEHCPGTKALRSGLACETEAQGKLDDGNTIEVLIRAFPVKDEAGTVIGFIEVVEDITERRRIEEELQKVETLETIGMLAGGLAHDFNNLLTAIMGNIELAKAEANPEKMVHQRLTAAEEACDQAKHLTDQLLTFARGGGPAKSAVVIQKMLEESCQFALSGSNLRYVLDAPEDLWRARLDKKQIEQVIYNLLINAKEAMPSGGKVFVVAENVEIDSGTDLPLAAGRYLKISIADEGEGVKPELLSKIFNPYFTTKDIGSTKGTGLGLTISYSIVHRHGGHITVHSEAGGGSTFTIYLPADEKTLKKAIRKESVIPDAGASYKILLLEDDREVSKTISNMFVHLRHRFALAPEGLKAVDLYRQAMENGEPFDLVILDLTIRGGMGGKETLLKIMEIDPEVKAVVSSGYTDDQVMENFLEFGFKGYLTKPFHLSTLKKVIHKAMQGDAAEP